MILCNIDSCGLLENFIKILFNSLIVIYNINLDKKKLAYLMNIGSAIISSFAKK